jgi:hypothetical protein
MGYAELSGRISAPRPGGGVFLPVQNAAQLIALGPYRSQSILEVFMLAERSIFQLFFKVFDLLLQSIEVLGQKADRHGGPLRR